MDGQKVEREARDFFDRVGADAEAAAGILLSGHEFERALALLRAPSAAPRRVSAARLLARALIGAGRAELALRYLRLCRRAYSGKSDFLTLQIAALTGLGRGAEAIRLMEEEIARAGRLSAGPANLLISLYASGGHIARAWALLRRADALGLDLPGAELQLLDGAIHGLDLDRATELADRIRHRVGGRRASQWRGTFRGQLMTELRLLRQDGRLPEMPDGAGAAEVLERLCAAMRAAPQSSLLALCLARAWVAGSAKGTRASPGAAPIPAVIHLFRSADGPVAAGWDRRPGHEVRQYDRASGLSALRREFGPRWVAAFRLARSPVEEQDLLRLCLLAKHGGIWPRADLAPDGDIGALVPPGSGLVLSLNAAGPGPGKELVAARPGHPVILAAAHMARAALLQRAAEHPWSKTGAGLLARAAARFISGELSAAGTTGAAGLHMPAAEVLARHLRSGAPPGRP